MSGDLSFIFDSPIIFKTVKYTANHTTALGMYLDLIPKYLVDLSLDRSVENMNPDTTPKQLLDDFCQRKKKNKRYEQTCNFNYNKQF
jgi:DNA repair ATPase RecN